MNDRLIYIVDVCIYVCVRVDGFVQMHEWNVIQMLVHIYVWMPVFIWVPVWRYAIDTPLATGSVVKAAACRWSTIYVFRDGAMDAVRDKCMGVAIKWISVLMVLCIVL